MNIAAVQFKINFLIFFLQSKQLTDYIYTDLYCIGQTPCSYEHYLVLKTFTANFIKNFEKYF